MKLVKIILELCLRFIASFIIISIITIGIVLIFPNIFDSELPLSIKQTLSNSYWIGMIAGVIVGEILQFIYKIINNYVWNRKKKHTIRFTFNDGGDVKEPLSNSGGRKDAD